MAGDEHVGADVAPRRHRALHAVAVAGLVAVLVTGLALGGVLVSAVLPGSVDSTPERPAPAGPSAAASRTALDGTWVVRALYGVDGTSVVPEEYEGKVWLAFTEDGVTGSTGCNSVSLTYEQTGAGGSDVRLKSGITTLVGCPTEVPLLDRLDAVRHVTGSVGVRHLRDADHKVVAELDQNPEADGLTLPCPESEQARTDLDVPGPGRASPEEAVAPLVDGLRTVADAQPGFALVHALDSDGGVVSRFTVTKRVDGWWPEAVVECGRMTRGS